MFVLIRQMLLASFVGMNIFLKIFLSNTESLCIMIMITYIDYNKSFADKLRETCELHMHRVVWISVTLGFHVHCKYVGINRRDEGPN
jgi:hypothetical protein